jgi:hypothetical protein
MMVKAEIVINWGKLKDIPKEVQATPEQFRREVRNELRNGIGPEIILDLRQRMPQKSKQPIVWTSPEQQKAFHATNGFGQGIPTVRSGQLENSFEARMRGNQYESVLEIVSTDPDAVYVIGKWRQRFHRNSGHYLLTDRVRAHQRRAMSVVKYIGQVEMSRITKG